jgi:phosphoribosylanthranilate isomerase
MKVKVCGITRVEQLKGLQEAGADYAGLILYQGSKRFAGLQLRDAMEEIKSIPIKKIGVFVNEALESVLRYIQEYGLHAVQLHGDESPEYCKALMEATTVIKVFRLVGDEDLEIMLEPFQDTCHYFLFDTATKEYGGSGRKFRWEVVEKAVIGKPFFLSGGIGTGDVESIRSFRHKWLEAVDINSSFEIEPGVKDLSKVSFFIKEVKGAEQS